MGNRSSGIILIIAGILMCLIGFGMYRNPHLDLESLSEAVEDLYIRAVTALNHFIEDPFAFLGFVMLILGAVVFVKGLGIIIFGRGRR